MIDTKFNEEFTFAQKKTESSYHITFTEVKKFQSFLRSVSVFSHQTNSKEFSRVKKIRRNKRLKDIYLGYFSTLKISPTAPKQALQVKPEVNLKSLIEHQTNYIKSKRKYKVSKEINSPPLYSKLKCLFSKPSYLINQKKTYSLASQFPHSCKTFKKKREKLSQILIKKIEKKQAKKLSKNLFSSLSGIVEKVVFKRYWKIDKSNQDYLPSSRVVTDETQDRSFTTCSYLEKYQRLGFTMFNKE